MKKKKRCDVGVVVVWWTSVPKDIFLAGVGTMLSDVLDVLVPQLSTVVGIQDCRRFGWRHRFHPGTCKASCIEDNQHA